MRKALLLLLASCAGVEDVEPIEDELALSPPPFPCGPGISTRSWSAPVRIGGVSGPLVLTTAPDVAVSSNGTAMAVWADRDGNDVEIRSSRYTVSLFSGTWQATPDVVASFTLGASDAVSSPQVTMDASGRAMVAWSQSEDGYFDVRASQFVPGTGWGSVTVVDPPVDMRNVPPPEIQVGSDAAGNVLAVWEGVRLGIYPEGRWATFTGTWSASSKLENWVQQPVLAVGAEGDAVAAWTDGNHVFVSRFDPTSVTWTPEERLFGDPMRDFNTDRPNVDVNAGGDAVVTWLANPVSGKPADRDLWATTQPNGGAWTTSELLQGRFRPDASHFAGAAIDDEGNAVSIWSEIALRSGRLAPDGTAVVRAERVTPVLNPTDHPAIGLAARGGGTAVWRRSNPHYNIYAAHLVHQPARPHCPEQWSWTPERRLDQIFVSAGVPSLAVSAQGVVQVVWFQFDSPTAGVFAASYR